MRTRVVHCKREPYDVYIGRPSIWGNPFVLGKDGDRDEVIRKFRSWLIRDSGISIEQISSLRGKTLGCWCHPNSCHGDVLAELADE